jgi:hypothetical protein
MPAWHFPEAIHPVRGAGYFSGSISGKGCRALRDCGKKRERVITKEKIYHWVFISIRGKSRFYLWRSAI